MSPAVYPLAQQAFLSAAINMASDDIKVVLLTSAYTYSATHQYYTDLTGTIQVSPTLASKSITNGTFNAANVTLSSVASGSTIAAFAGFYDTGTPSTSPLIWFNDGFSQLTNGGAIVIDWDSGSSKIFVI